MATDLLDVHRGWDNFFHEVPIMEKIMTFIDRSTDIPGKVAFSLIKSVMMCRIGKGTAYSQGVSGAGKPLYDQFFKLLGDDFVPLFIVALTKLEIQQKMSRDVARRQAIEMIKVFKESIVNERYGECLDYLIRELPRSEKSIYNSDFKKLSSFLDWK